MYRILPLSFGQSICSVIHSDEHLPTHTTDMENLYIAPEAVTTLLALLNSYMSAGPGGLWPSLLHLLCHIILTPIADLFDNSLDTGVNWWRARETPNLKTGMKTLINKYRSIRFRPILCKVIECIICDKTATYFHRNRPFQNALEYHISRASSWSLIT